MAPPPSAERVEDAAFFFRLAQRMGLQLSWTQTPGYRAHLEGPTQTLPFDMRREPSNEDLIALTCANSRLPLDEVKRHPHGRVFDEAKVRVAPRDPACTAMLQLADPLMMAELAQVRAEAPRQAALDGQRTQLLVSRRLNRVMNSVGQPFATAVEGDGDGATPGFMPSADLAALALALAPGDLAKVASAHGEMRVRLIADDDWRTGVPASRRYLRVAWVRPRARRRQRDPTGEHGRAGFHHRPASLERGVGVDHPRQGGRAIAAVMHTR